MKDMTEYIAECNGVWNEPAANNRNLYYIHRVAIPNTLYYEFERYLEARNIPHIHFGTASWETLMDDPEEWENRP